MFKHILIPTDGSRASETAAFRGIDMARESGARITALHVSPQFHVLTYRSGVLGGSREEFERDARTHAASYMEVVAKAAREAGVLCATLCETHDRPYQAIVEAARRLECDLILMGSHGRRGVADMFMGSETQRVLVHSTVPVLVWR
jgi:nucleotide-binding universal stress UspA family protein